MEALEWQPPPPPQDASASWGWSDSAPQAHSVGGLDRSDGWESYNSDGSYLQEFENVMSWDDSGALEALQLSRERMRAKELGLLCDVPLPRPDLYNEKIDWNAKPFMPPEVAEAWASIEEKKPGKGQKSSRRSGKSSSRRRVDKGSDQRFGNKDLVDSKELASLDGQQYQLTPTGWNQPAAPQQAHFAQQMPWNNNNNLSQEQDRYRGWENCYSQGGFSGPPGLVNYASQWQENAYSSACWKPNGASVRGHWQQGKPPCPVAKDGRWNNRQPPHKRW